MLQRFVFSFAGFLFLLFPMNLLKHENECVSTAKLILGTKTCVLPLFIGTYLLRLWHFCIHDLCMKKIMCDFYKNFPVRFNYSLGRFFDHPEEYPTLTDKQEFTAYQNQDNSIVYSSVTPAKIFSENMKHLEGIEK